MTTTRPSLEATGCENGEAGHRVDVLVAALLLAKRWSMAHVAASLFVSARRRRSDSALAARASPSSAAACTA
eukprot:CAMPEP_0171073228 /NCGR_PEP_ID=MMETSP0766_2-20121228/11374_1 /TAXON_ID=439317 /ORGANISM="Gambierdiscus australes, Strain CAWD 149" /LENGTH=71 /DNA_ID=CAMNT_0011529899 /DNA_START=171 /DNA_END=383 /DNA_ORIENTATION=+